MAYLSKKILLAGFSVILAFQCLAGPVEQLKKRLEANHDHAFLADTLGRILEQGNWSDTDRLALQTLYVEHLLAQQKFDTSIFYCQREIAKARQKNDPYAESNLLKLLGNAYYNAGNTGLALNYWGKSLTIAEQKGYLLVQEYVNHNIGAIELETGTKLPDAEQRLLKAIELASANGRTRTPAGIQHYRVLASLYDVKNERDKAIPLFVEIERIARSIGDSGNLVASLIFHSKCLLEQNKVTEAVRKTEEAVAIARKLGGMDYLQTSISLHINSLKAAGRAAEALEFSQELNKTIVDHYKSDLAENISTAEARFRNAEVRREKELALLKARKQNQLILLAAIALTALIGLSVYFFYKRKSLRQKIFLQEEKQRLSRDLHDNLGSQLALLSYNVDHLDLRYKQQTDISPYIGNTKQASRQLLQTLRETIWVLNKESVTSQDFFSKLVDYAQRYLQMSSNMELVIEENLSSEKNLTSTEALQLFRMCQESINNACKHSGASRLLVSAAVQHGKLEVCISDNGQGFDPAAVDKNMHYGITNLYIRAKEIGATCSLDTAPGKGTSLFFSI